MTTTKAAHTAGPDWYERRDELLEGMVFQSCYGLVKLDHRNPGDGTQWVVATWHRGFPAGRGYDECKPHWSYEEMIIEPGDLEGEPIKDSPAAIAKATGAA